jgi:hypothetical protein
VRREIKKKNLTKEWIRSVGIIEGINPTKNSLKGYSGLG